MTQMVPMSLLNKKKVKYFKKTISKKKKKTNIPTSPEKKKQTR